MTGKGKIRRLTLLSSSINLPHFGVRHLKEAQTDYLEGQFILSLKRFLIKTKFTNVT